jgi:hypothetical protein
VPAGDTLHRNLADAAHTAVVTGDVAHGYSARRIPMNCQRSAP